MVNDGMGIFTCHILPSLTKRKHLSEQKLHRCERVLMCGGDRLLLAIASVCRPICGLIEIPTQGSASFILAFASDLSVEVSFLYFL